MTQTVQQMVSAAKREIENLTPEQVARELARGDVVLLDLREMEERDQHGAIPGAIHAPRGMLEFYADPATPYHKKEIDRGARIILHCAAGSRSALAGKTLREMGFEDVAHLDGGFKAWVAAGQPTKKP